MEDIVFRKATFDDLKDIVELGDLIAEFDMSDTPIEFWDYDTLKKCVSDIDSGLILTAYNEKELAGFSVVTYNKVFKKAIIEDIFVSPKYRNMGIARNMYNMIIDELKENNFDTLSMTTEFNNTSIIKFFEKNGFDKFQNKVELVLNI